MTKKRNIDYYIELNNNIINKIKDSRTNNNDNIIFKKEDIRYIKPLPGIKLMFELKDNSKITINFREKVVDELLTDLAIDLYNEDTFLKVKIDKNFTLSFPNGLIIDIDTLLQFIF